MFAVLFKLLNVGSDRNWLNNIISVRLFIRGVNSLQGKMAFRKKERDRQQFSLFTNEIRGILRNSFLIRMFGNCGFSAKRYPCANLYENIIFSHFCTFSVSKSQLTKCFRVFTQTNFCKGI